MYTHLRILKLTAHFALPKVHSEVPKSYVIPLLLFLVTSFSCEADAKKPISLTAGTPIICNLCYVIIVFLH